MGDSDGTEEGSADGVDEGMDEGVELGEAEGIRDGSDEGRGESKQLVQHSGREQFTSGTMPAQSAHNSANTPLERKLQIESGMSPNTLFKCNMNSDSSSSWPGSTGGMVPVSWFLCIHKSCRRGEFP